MSYSTHTSTVSISSDEIHDLLVNSAESFVTLDDQTPATLRNVTDHCPRKVEGKTVHTFTCILTLKDIYEHDAKVELVEDDDMTQFNGTILYQVQHGGLMAE